MGNVIPIEEGKPRNKSGFVIETGEDIELTKTLPIIEFCLYKKWI